jgi:hypothetical protein
VQEIESVTDEMHAALPVRRHLGLGEARQPGFIDAAEFSKKGGPPPRIEKAPHPDAAGAGQAGAFTGGVTTRRLCLTLLHAAALSIT